VTCELHSWPEAERDQGLAALLALLLDKAVVLEGQDVDDPGERLDGFLELPVFLVGLG
jgi:hypothetical protein